MHLWRHKARQHAHELFKLVNVLAAIWAKELDRAPLDAAEPRGVQEPDLRRGEELVRRVLPAVQERVRAARRVQFALKHLDPGADGQGLGSGRCGNCRELVF